MSTATLSSPPTRATIDDLMKYDGKAELIGGKVVPQMTVGFAHSRIASRIFSALVTYEKQTHSGYALDDNVAYAVPELLSGRETFSPDASYFIGPRLAETYNGAVPGPPTFAVEVRSPEDYGPKAESEMAMKRDDYFEAGTKAIWDVNTRTESVTLYVLNLPPQVFGIGETAHAEPSLPGWSMSVDEVFGR